MATPAKNREDSATSAEAEVIAQSSGAGKASHNERDVLAALGAELLRRATEGQPALEAAWDALMDSWGVRGVSVGVHRLRAMIQEECGANPEENAFSRELIALRADRQP